MRMRVMALAVVGRSLVCHWWTEPFLLHRCESSSATQVMTLGLRKSPTRNKRNVLTCFTCTCVTVRSRQKAEKGDQCRHCSPGTCVSPAVLTLPVRPVLLSRDAGRGTQPRFACSSAFCTLCYGYRLVLKPSARYVMVTDLSFGVLHAMLWLQTCPLSFCTLCYGYRPVLRRSARYVMVTDLSLSLLHAMLWL